jgi:hypothetical protein
LAILSLRDVMGFEHKVEIDGDTPSKTEQVRIDKFIADKNAFWQPKKNDNPGIMSDVGNELKAGTGEAVAGAGWLAGKIAPDTGKEIEDYGKSVTDKADAALSPQAQKADQDGILAAEGVGGKVRALVQSGARSLPAMAATIPITAGAALLAPEVAVGAAGVAGVRVLSQAARPVLGYLERNLAKSFVEKGIAATPELLGKTLHETVGRSLIGMLNGAVGEGLVAAGMDGKQASDWVTQYAKDQPEAFASTEYGKAALAESGGNMDRAIDIAKRKVANAVALKTGVLTGLLALPGAAWEASLAVGGLHRGLAREALQGLGVEAAQEVPQSGAEQYAINAEEANIDPTISPWQGVLRSAVEGGLVGGAFGASLGAAGSQVGHRTERAAVQRQADLDKWSADDAAVGQGWLAEGIKARQRDLPDDKPAAGAPSSRTLLLPAPTTRQADPDVTLATLRDVKPQGELRAEATDGGFRIYDQDSRAFSAPFPTKRAADAVIGHYRSERALDQQDQINSERGKYDTALAAARSDYTSKYKAANAQTLQAAARETSSTPYISLPLAELPTHVAAKVHNYRTLRGLDVSDSSTTVQELRDAGVAKDTVQQAIVKAAPVTEGTGTIQNDEDRVAPEDATPEFLRDQGYDIPEAPKETAPEAPAPEVHQQTQAFRKAAAARVKKTKAGEIARVLKANGKKPSAANVKAVVDRLVDDELAQENARRTAKQNVPVREVSAKKQAPEPAKIPSGNPKVENLRPVWQSVRNELDKRGFRGVGLKLQSMIEDNGEVSAGEATGRLIRLSTSIYGIDPRVAPQRLAEILSSVMDHELIHIISRAGLFTESELKALGNFVKSTAYVDENGGVRKFSFLDAAIRRYGKYYTPAYMVMNERAQVEEAARVAGEDPTDLAVLAKHAVNHAREAIVEEAVADAFRAWVKHPQTVVHGRIRGMFNKILNLFRHLTKLHDNKGVNSLFDAITSGNMAARGGLELNSGMRRPMHSVRLRKGQGEDLSAYGVNPGDKIKMRRAAEALEQRTRDMSGTIKSGDHTDKARDKIANWMLEEVLFELQPKNIKKSAYGWYSKKFQRALNNLSHRFPEMTDDSIFGSEDAPPGLKLLRHKRDARDYITTLIAITSDGQKVKANFQMAVDLYEQFRNNGVLPTDFIAGGNGNKSMRMNAAKINTMMAESGPKFLRKISRRQIEARELIAELRKQGVKNIPKIPADMIVPWSAVIFGPKLGAFYANLMGEHGYLTMDRWWTRTFNRMRGILTSKPTRQGIDRVKRLVSAERRLNEPWQQMTDEAAIFWANEYRKPYAAKGFKDGTELEKAANTVAKMAEGLREAPLSPSERTFMVATAHRVQELLKDRGHDLSIADIQALIWYYEKRLFGDLGIRQTDDISYEDAALLAAGAGPDAGHSGGAGVPRGAGDAGRALPADTGKTGRGRKSRSVADDGAGGRGGEARAEALAREGGSEQVSRLPGLPSRSPGGVQSIRDAKARYLEAVGLPNRRQAVHVTADPARGARIAEAYDAMPHDPSNPAVRSAYEAMAAETIAQYQLVLDMGIELEPIPAGFDPYPEGPMGAIKDLHKGHLWFFPTEQGYGTSAITDADIRNNPLLAPTEFEVKGHRMLVNDLFRVVHDVFGHGLEGAGFGASGEENAWQSHVRMYTPLAAKAMTSETRGQNSWVNFGPFGEQNRANQRETVYADQKVGLLPDWAMTDGVADDHKAEPTRSMRAAPVEDAPSRKSRAGGPFGERVPALNPTRLQGAKARVLHDAIGDMARRADNGLEKVFRRRFGLEKKADHVVFLGVDKFVYLAKAVDYLNKFGYVEDAFDAYVAADARASKTGARIDEAEKHIYKPLLDRIRGLGVNAAQVKQIMSINEAAARIMNAAPSTNFGAVEAYAQAKHAPERNAVIRVMSKGTDNAGSGITDAEAKEITDWYEGSAFAQPLINASNELQKLLADVRKVRKDGDLSPDWAAKDAPKAFRDAGLPHGYQHFVPMREGIDDGEDDEVTQYVRGRGLSVFGKEDKSHTGRSSVAGSVIEHAILMHMSSIIRAEKNLVDQTLFRMAKTNADTHVEGVPDNQPGEDKGLLERSGAIRILDFLPRKKVVVDGVIRYVPNNTLKQDPHTIVAKFGGKEVIMRVSDPRLAASLNGGDGSTSAEANALLAGLNKVMRTLAMLATSVNPEFILGNIPRDVMDAIVNTGQYHDVSNWGMVKQLGGIWKGLAPYLVHDNRPADRQGGYEDWTWAQKFDLMKKHGGVPSFQGIQTLRHQIAQAHKSAMDATGMSPMGLKAKGKAVFDYIGKVNEMAEYATRMMVFDAMMKAGHTPQAAAHAARNMTVNFNGGGQWKSILNSLYLFYNASARGIFSMVNGAIRSKRVQKTMVGIAVAGFMQELVGQMLSGGDDDEDSDYEKLSKTRPWDLEHSIVVPIPGSRTFFRLPLPHGMNAIWNTGRNMARIALGKGEFGTNMLSVGNTLANAVNPIGGWNHWANFVAPTIMDPIIDLYATGKDFSGRDIHPQQDRFGVPKPLSQLYWSTANPLLKDFTDAIHKLGGGTDVTPAPSAFEWNPENLEYVIDTIVGGVGQTVLRGLTFPLHVKEAAEGDAEFELNKVPGVRKFFQNATSREDMSAYFEERDRLNVIKAEFKDAREKGDTARVRDVLANHKRDLQMSNLMTRWEQQRSKLNQRIKQVQGNQHLPDEAKQRLIRQLKEQSDRIVSQAQRQLSRAAP